MSEDWQRKRMIKLDKMLTEIIIVLNSEINSEEALKGVTNILLTDDMTARLLKVRNQ